MKTLTSALLLLTFAFGGWGALAGDPLPRQVRKAEYHFAEFDYFDALEGFFQARKAYADDTFIVRRIADCYRLMGVPEEALRWYRRLNEMGGHDSEDLFHLAEVYRMLGHYEMASATIAKYQKVAPIDSRARRITANPDYHVKLRADEHDVNVEATGANIGRALLPPTAVNELLFIPIASELDGPWYAHRRNLISYNLYQTNVDAMYNLVSAELITGDVNTRFSEGPSCYDSKRETLMVTRFLTKRGRPALDFKGGVFSMILCYQLEEGRWVESALFPHNDEATSAAYPALSPDGNTLYFSSNRDGGLGGMDLFSCRWDARTGQWGEPENLGPDINTEGNEIYPQFGPDGSFSFASDGHPGLGGLDIFFADLNANNIVVRNPGIPVNSPNDDFGLMYIGDRYGYFCSDRNATAGGDDLFWWEAMREIIEATIVLMDESGNPMYPSKVEIKNLRTDQTALASGTRGQFRVNFNGRDPYELSWKHDGEAKTMFCRPEHTPTGLRYVYSSLNEGSFTADATVNSYRESAHRQKKVFIEHYTSKNLTDSEYYPATVSDAPKFMMASWEGGMSGTPHPAEGSKVYLKNLETGAVVSSTVHHGKAEFVAGSEHLYAMTWKDATDQKIVRYLKPDATADAGLAFINGDACTLTVNEQPLFAENSSSRQLLTTALTASSENGVLLEDVADLLQTYAEAGRAVMRSGDGTRIHAEDVYFGFDKFVIGTEERLKLEELAEVSSKVGGSRIEIIAHTDSRGQRSYNERLSRLRAQAAKKELIRYGVSESQISIAWHGEDAPVNDCIEGVPCSAQKHRMNRRAEVYLVLPEAPTAMNH